MTKAASRTIFLMKSIISIDEALEKATSRRSRASLIGRLVKLRLELTEALREEEQARCHKEDLERFLVDLVTVSK